MPEEWAGYRETITTSAEAEGRFIRQSGRHNQYAIVWLKMEPLERGKGIEFINALAEGVLPQEYIKSVEEGIREGAENGILRGLPMTDLRVTLLDGSYHEVDSSVRYPIAKARGL